MENKEFLESIIKKSTIKIELIKSAIEQLFKQSNVNLQHVQDCFDVLREEENYLAHTKKSLEDEISGAAKRKAEAMKKLGIGEPRPPIEVSHE